MPTDRSVRPEDRPLRSAVLVSVAPEARRPGNACASRRKSAADGKLELTNSERSSRPARGAEAGHDD